MSASLIQRAERAPNDYNQLIKTILEFVTYGRRVGHVGGSIVDSHSGTFC